MKTTIEISGGLTRRTRAYAASKRHPAGDGRQAGHHPTWWANCPSALIVTQRLTDSSAVLVDLDTTL